MMSNKSKLQLAEKARLKYTGKAFNGFHAENPFMTFLGYDSNSWSHIWAEYFGQPHYLSISDIEIATEEQ
jgi:hypothetical protein